MSTFYADSASLQQLSVTTLTAQTSSILYVTQSTLNIQNGLITANTYDPILRFGGFAVVDSGSGAPYESGSILFDSQNNQFIYVHKNAPGSAVTSSVFLVGPQTYNDIGNETYPTLNKILKSVNAEHLGDSNISDTGTVVSINSNTEITGSLLVTTGITGSLQGTASYATQAFSASYAPYSTGNLATAQARRTTGYTLTNTFAIITMDTTDVENQVSIISHDNTNTERIYVYSTGLYLIHYHVDVTQGTSANDFEFAVSKNGASNNISGSLTAGKNSSTDKIVASTNVMTLLNANDYVTLVGRYPAASGGVANNAVLSVTKMEGVAGPQGPSGSAGAPGGVTQIVAGTNITISPIGGTGTVTINSTAAGGSVDLGKVISQTQLMYPFTGF